MGSSDTTHGIVTLDTRYVDREIMHGEQWLLRLQFEGRDHVTYCSNRFPPAILAFARDLDALLAEAGLADARWTEIEGAHAGEHDDQLWDALYARP